MKRTLHSISLLLATTLVMGQANNYPNGSTVANFTVTDTDGNTHELYQYTAQGKYVMLDFFFDTCPPCQQTQPFYNQLHEVYGCNSADLIVLSINNGTDSDAEVIAFENTYGGPYAHAPAVSAEGGGGPVTAAFGVTAFPTYCLIAPDNKMSNNDIWPISNMQTFVNAFPTGSGINPAACPLVGIEEADAFRDMNVFPVPTTGLVQVELPGHITGNLVTEVHDAVGRLVHTANINAAVSTLDLGSLHDGQYLLSVRNADGQAAVRRIVVAR
jgi:thiol-disulfide isomerase/thioredoxin